jgi:hypothetical protein
MGVLVTEPLATIPAAGRLATAPIGTGALSDRPARKEAAM